MVEKMAGYYPPGQRHSRSAIDRFEELCIPEPNSGCWLWVGSVNWRGYSEFKVNKKLLRGHRWAYEHFVGPIPAGMTIDHLCRVRSCVNPDHLAAVSQKENLLRGNSPSAINARKTHCKKGHPLSGENLLIHKKGNGYRRQCRACHGIAQPLRRGLAQASRAL